MEELLSRSEVRLATALVIGLVIGAERQQRIAEGGQASAGIRTFALAALLGGIAALLGGWAPLVLFGGAVSAAAVTAYAMGARTDPGVTTEIAIVLAYALGALAMSEPQFSLGVGIVVAMILAFRDRIHEVVSRTVSPAELRDVLLFAAAALVVLPIAPNEPLDPLGAFNPFVVWRLAVVMMGVMLAAHVARRMLGERWGIVVAGLASGFVSSSATVAAMGAKATEAPERSRAFLAAGAASSVATFIQMAVLVGTASPALLRSMALPLGTGGLAAFLFAAYFTRGGGAAQANEPEPRQGANEPEPRQGASEPEPRQGASESDASELDPRQGASEPDPRQGASEPEVSPASKANGASALRVRDALLFALLVSLVTFLAGLVEDRAGAAGVVLGSAVAAFADAHAAGASLAAVHAGGRLEAWPAMVGVLVCLTTNGGTKGFLAWSSGPRSYAKLIVVGQVIALGAAWLALAIASLL